MSVPPAAAASPLTAYALPDAPRPVMPCTQLVRLGIDTGDEQVIYLHEDSPICRAEGFGAHSRVQISIGERCLFARLNVVRGACLGAQQVGLSEPAWVALAPQPHELAIFAHPASIESLARVRAKIHGQSLSAEDFQAIVRDIAQRRYSTLELAAFITACAGGHLSLPEISSLTGAMVATGARLDWPRAIVLDKHCIGGVPGNRTTPIVVAIVTSLGLLMPKTSSRAITSPAGTADTMEMLAPVVLSLRRMRDTVERTGGCLVWGGSIGLSPADDVMIRIERALDIDSEGQLVASVLSKKIAAGSSHILIDLPVGPSAKIREVAKAQSLAGSLRQVANDFGLQVRCLLTDGSQPIGRGVGPALEALDVLAVLQGDASAPARLRDRAIALAAALLQIAAVAADEETALWMANQALNDGCAWRQFQAICEAQGGMRIPGRAAQQYPVCATRDGWLQAVDNRRLSRVAKLAGAPLAPSAGLEWLVHVGERIELGQPIFTVHAQTRGELAYALDYVRRHPCIVTLAQTP